MHTRRKFVVAMGASALAAQSLQGAMAQQGYPNKPIRFVMPYPPGGSSEILARPIAAEMTRNIGQSVFIDFKPGGGTTIGADLIAKSAPDGYNIVMMLTAHAVNATLMAKLPYDTVKDFASITLAATLPLVVVVNAQSPIRTLADLIAAAKANPGKLNYASAGPGNTSHLAVEYFKSVVGVDMTHVPYKGSGPAITALLGRFDPLLRLRHVHRLDHLGVELLHDGRRRACCRQDRVPDRHVEALDALFVNGRHLR